MAFVHLGGNAGDRPTYFEVYAADKLVPSLKAAIIYSLSVLGQRRTWVARSLAFEDEIAALAALLLDRQSLQAQDATFAESLYGLQRRAAPRSGACAAWHGASSASGHSTARSAVSASAGDALQRLTWGQAWMALAAEVALPYLEVKARRAYAQHRARGVLGLAAARAAVSLQRPAQEPAGPGQAVLSHLRSKALAWFLAAYPALQSVVDGARFVYQLLYLLGKSPYHSPIMHLLGQRLVRVSAQQLAQLEQAKQRRRAASLSAARTGGSWATRLGRLALLHAWHFLQDHSRSALILSVFLFKALEWWYSSAEERLSASQALPPPPPPKAPPPAQWGCGLPQDPGICPVCRRPRTNPAMCAVSGYVYCYPCIFNAIATEACCPVTHFPAGLEHVRKLYEA